MREGDAEKVERIEAATTLEEVVALAIQFEEAAAEFYRLQLQRVSKPLRWLVEELIAEEESHAERLRQIERRPDLHDLLLQQLEQPIVDPRFSDAIQTPEADQFNDDQAVLQYALGREQLAMEQYGRLAAVTPEGPLRDLFLWLEQEEVGHKGELEKRYYDLVHRSGGV